MEHQEGVTPQQKAQSTATHSSEETTEMFRWLKDNIVTRDEFHEELAKFATKEDLKSFATKEDMKKAIAEAKHELKDHTTRECAKVRDIFFDVAHEQDKKTNEFVRTAQKSGTISRADGARLIALNPFAPQPAD